MIPIKDYGIKRPHPRKIYYVRVKTSALRILLVLGFQTNAARKFLKSGLLELYRSLDPKQT